MRPRFRPPNFYQDVLDQRIYLWIVLLVVGASVSFCSFVSTWGRGMGNDIPCPLPPQVRRGHEPLQTAVPAAMGDLVLATTTVRPVAGFSVEARILSRRNYKSGFEAKLSPTDLALGWKRMSEPALVSQIKVRQRHRHYQISWDTTPPLAEQDMLRSSANMHIIPATNAVARALAFARKGDHVRIDGWLVEAYMPPSREPWRSSTTRTDTGRNSSEVVYACALTQL
jgi:hypothetical protein